MSRLIVHVEGETEETFVNEVLAGHLRARGYLDVSARLLGNSRLRDKRGGIKSWPAVRREILNHLRQDRGCVATTMVDFYALPAAGAEGWPGRASSMDLPSAKRAEAIEAKLSEDISTHMGEGFNPLRFVPFVVMHEFEGLLFSDCDAFGRGIGQPGLAPSFRGIRAQFASPEDINDSPATAPSKRIKHLLPGYEKSFLGVLAVLEMGLEAIRKECPHFAAWLSRLERSAPSARPRLA